jgi:predicted DNA-binding transcriptional regulator YafY
MRLDRLLSIIITLLNRDTMTAPALARKYGVSVRTIYRDLDAVQQAGIPLVAYQGNKGGYGIMENYRLDRQLLTLSDMAAILAALKGIQTTLPAAEVEQAVEKIGSLVPRDKRDAVSEFNERIAVDMTGWSYNGMRREVLRCLYGAVVARRLVKFVYRNLKGEEKTRLVEPMTLLYKGSSWYLYGFCRTRSDYRLFHVGRIKDPAVQAAVFKRRAVPLAEFMSRTEEPDNTTEIVLKFPVSQRLKVEEFYPEDRITRRGDYLYASARFPLDEWTYGVILSYGDLCEVVEPPAVREKIKKMVQAMNSYYQT